MKIPKIFLPEKDLEEKIIDLKSYKKNKIKSLNDLVLWQDSDEFMGCNSLSDSDFETYYSLLDPESIEEKVEAKYDDITIHALKFVDQNLLKENAKTIRDILSLFNKKNHYSQGNAVIKDEYVIFLYTFLGDSTNRMRFVNAYKKKFGFRELKQ